MLNTRAENVEAAKKALEVFSEIAGGKPEENVVSLLAAICHYTDDPELQLPWHECVEYAYDQWLSVFREDRP